MLRYSYRAEACWEVTVTDDETHQIVATEVVYDVAAIPAIALDIIKELCDAEV